ncbi:MAG: YwiC-like family protein [Chloroflexota bacterium]
MQPASVFQRNIAIPQDHGAWVFLLSPLLIGLFIGKGNVGDVKYLVIAALAAFLVRQPITIIVKIFANRRARKYLLSAVFWIVVYGIIGLFSLYQLIAAGNTYLVWLPIPGIMIFVWYLRLVSRKEERRQQILEILASGSLSLAAPAGLWISQSYTDNIGWWLWALSWAQASASILYAFLRLEQRTLLDLPKFKTKLNMGKIAFGFAGANLGMVILLIFFGILPGLLWLPFALQFAETVRGILNPAIGLKPTRIGIRQLIVSTIFTIMFIQVWQ